jgi:toxin ParE1/3/4
MKYTFDLAALLELDEAMVWYNGHRAGLGLELLARVKETIEEIRRHPGQFQLVTRRHRRAKVKRFPYGVVYRIEGDFIRIICVMQLNRRPGYWKKRDK